MDKKTLVAMVVTFIVVMGLGFVVHGTWLASDYKALSHLYRPEQEQMQMFPFMLIAHLLMAVGFTLLYRRYRVAGGDWLKQGLSFGFLLALAIAIPMFMIYYAVQPMPSATVIKQIVGDTASYLIVGVVLGYLYK